MASSIQELLPFNGSRSIVIEDLRITHQINRQLLSSLHLQFINDNLLQPFKLNGKMNFRVTALEQIKDQSYKTKNNTHNQYIDKFIYNSSKTKLI